MLSRPRRPRHRRFHGDETKQCLHRCVFPFDTHTRQRAHIRRAHNGRLVLRKTAVSANPSPGRMRWSCGPGRDARTVVFRWIRFPGPGEKRARACDFECGSILIKAPLSDARHRIGCGRGLIKRRDGTSPFRVSLKERGIRH